MFKINSKTIAAVSLSLLMLVIGMALVDHNDVFQDVSTGGSPTFVDITATGTITAGVDIDATGDMSAGGDIDATGSVSAGVDVSATGDLSAGDDLTVDDDATITDALSIGGSALVGSILDNDIYILDSTISFRLAEAAKMQIWVTPVNGNTRIDSLGTLTFGNAIGGGTTRLQVDDSGLTVAASTVVGVSSLVGDVADNNIYALDSTLAFRSLTTDKVKLTASPATGDAWLDVLATFRIRDTIGGGTTNLSLTADGDLTIAGAFKRKYVDLNRAAVSDADYNPSAATLNELIAFTSLTAARSCIISVEDTASGTTAEPRVFIIKDEAGAAGTYPITVSLETGQIDGANSVPINVNYNAIILYLYDTTGHIY